ncbi:hypothetical protein POV27_09370 [Aureisphaera galaxeae]|uniref:DUF6702 family protein n=1 Tax=Aureisphaera galaxeae TaxID=1538023 RepID=UPI00234FE2A4|nr:DUF6702 family protein [Aureisphaera galaxeae]MDC8004259.1 hypothetical protein [Aureisphaera galaxeae]
MRKLFILTLLFVGISINYSAADHPIKLTSSMIKYDAKTKSIRVECKVFFDDFAPVISASLIKSINQSNLTKDDLRRIENYFIEKYKITINGKTLPWEIKSYDIAKRETILTLVFTHSNITLNKGDQIHIENALLFEVFGDIQSNWMTLRFPPFLKNEYFECTTFNQKYSHTL